MKRSIFVPDPDIAEKMNQRYADLSMPVFRFPFGPLYIEVQQVIVTHLLRIPVVGAMKKFQDLFGIFARVLGENGVPSKPMDILLIADEEVKTPMSAIRKEVEDGSSTGHIIFPPSLLTGPEVPWSLALFHELAHCWTIVDIPDIAHREIFMDLLALCALRQILSPEKRDYREIVKRYSLGRPEVREVLDASLQRYILERPEAYLRAKIDGLRRGKVK